MRLIDADALERNVQNEWERNEISNGDWIQFREWLKDEATIDAVPVVRCGECRWHEDEEPGMVYCPATVGGWVENDYFCKHGERKDGDNK